MIKIILEIMNGRYVPNRLLYVDRDRIDLVRSYYAQFGLGIETGIGFPNEITGLKKDLDYNEAGNYLDIAIGQLDTYTPLQLAQYISTIANGGYRMRPMLVKEIRSPDPEGIGNIVYQIQPEVLNRLTMDEEFIKRTQEGLWQVTHGSRGTGRGFFGNEPYNPAGKTGSAESFLNGKSTVNSTFVAFAPYENPEIAIAVVVPNAYTTKKSPYYINQQIARRVLRAYFDLKEQNPDTDDFLENYEPEVEDDRQEQEENMESPITEDMEAGGTPEIEE